MTGRISDEKVDEIRERVDMVELVSSYVALKRSGANHFGLCPFHSEKTPSFSVSASRQRYHCFGCGEGGDAFSFLMQMEGLSFPEAVRRLGERVGVEVEEERPDPEQERRRRERERLHRVNEAVADFYHRLLMRSAEGEPARRYLKARGYDGQIARQFLLGYAPDRWETLAGHLQELGVEASLARQLGLVREGKEGRGDYDLFRGRLIFPILGTTGQIAAFGGRVLGDGHPKYINSPESPVYHKGNTLYGLAQGRETIRRSGEVIVVEGYFDLLALHRAGFGNVVATCGTALTEDHAKLLRRYVEKVHLLFDQDRAGRSATFRAMDVLLPAGMSVSVIELEAGDDPDTFLPREGQEAFVARLDQARPSLEVFIEESFAGRDGSVEGVAQAAEDVLSKLSLLPSDLQRDLYIKKLAEQSGIAVDLLTNKLREQLAQKEAAGQRGHGLRRQVPPPPEAPPVPPREMPAEKGAQPRSGMQRPTSSAGGAPTGEEKARHWLLNMMVHDSAARRRVAAEGLATFFSGEPLCGLAGRLLALFDERDEWTPQELVDRLSPEQKSVFSGILLADAEIFAEEPERIFDDCRKATEKGHLKKRSRELPGLIRQAELDGDWDGVTRLNREMTEIKIKLKNIV